MSAEKVGVMIGMPFRHWKGTEGFHPFLKAALQILAQLSTQQDCPYEFTLSVAEGGLVRSRNGMVHNFKKSGCRLLVTLDDDMQQDTPQELVDDILKLLGHRKPVVGGMYTSREARAKWIANFMHEVELQKNGLLQVIELGAGIKCYHRQTFAELDRLIGDKIIYTDRDTGERMMGYYQHGVIRTDLQPDGDLLPEDYFLDWLCRQCGIAIWADTTIRVKHRGADGTLYPLNDDWPPLPIDEVKS